MVAACRRRLALAWFCLLFAALPRALLPAGLMPSFGGDRIALSYCVGDGGGSLLRQAGEPSPPAETGCAFALAQATALPVSESDWRAAWFTGIASFRRAATRPGHLQHPPRLPSQAPPFESVVLI